MSDFFRHSFWTWFFGVQPSLMIYDLQLLIQWSSIMHRDYYWIIMDYQHDSGLKLFLDIEISCLRNFLTLNFFNFKFLNDLWSLMIDQRSSIMHRDYYWLIMDYQHDSGLKLFLDIEISQLNNFFTWLNDLWSSMMHRDYNWLIMDYQHDSGLRLSWT